MDKLTIKRISVAEIEQLISIAKQTFIETFANNNTAENIRNYLTDNMNEHKLLHELINLNSEFYFALFNENIVGYLKINFGTAQTEIKDKSIIEIERIYVLNQFHGKQIGKALLNYAIKIANNINAEYLWLGVWEENKKAINFYINNNFVVFDKHIFKLGNEEQVDLMMKLQLH